MKFKDLDTTQLQNAALIDTELVAIGFTNKFFRAGVLSVAMKESGLMPKREMPYNTTPNGRIREIWPVLFGKMSDGELNKLKMDPVRFFNYVYNSNKFLGNRPGTNDGYDFRGWGFNQNTGRYITERVAKHYNLPLLTNPEMLNQPDVCAKALAFFNRVTIVANQMNGKFQAQYGIGSTSQITDIQLGAHLAHWTNAGFGILPEDDPTGGWKTVRANALDCLTWINKR